MENMLKKIIIISLGGLLLYISIVFIINNKEAKQLQNNNIVNSAINNKVFKDKVKIVKLIESIDPSYSSSNSIKLLHANNLIEEGKYDESLLVLDSIKQVGSTISTELTYSLKARALASKGSCNESQKFFNNISKYNSIKQISSAEIKGCMNQKGGI